MYIKNIYIYILDILQDFSNITKVIFKNNII